MGKELTRIRRGMAAFNGKDVQKLKNKGGKWKYMSEQDMLDQSLKFAPYRYAPCNSKAVNANSYIGVCS